MKINQERTGRTVAVHLMWMATIIVAVLYLSMTIIDLGARFTELSEDDVAAYSKVASFGLSAWTVVFFWFLAHWWPRRRQRR